MSLRLLAAIVRGLRRNWVVSFGLLALIVVSGGLFEVARAASLRPPELGQADLFMRSIVSRDGALGWRQLCPDVQAELPQSVLVEQADAARAEDARQGTTLEAQPVPTQAGQDGGEQRSYLVTARRANGQVDKKLFVVRTQASGCVESVE